MFTTKGGSDDDGDQTAGEDYLAGVTSKHKLTAEEKVRAKALLRLAETAKHKNMKLADLKVDTVNYQCVLDAKRVQHIVDNFFAPAVNPIVLVKRVTDGVVQFYIVNGQHTRAALTIKGYKSGECIVLDDPDITIQDEALVFLVLNDKDTHVAPTLRKTFPARVTSGEPNAVALNAILTETKTPLGGKSPAAISSLPTLEMCYAYDKGASLKRGILICRRAYNGIKVPGGIVHAVVGIIHGCAGKIEEDRLVRILQSKSPREWSNIVKDHCNGAKPYSRLMPHHYAQHFLKDYNKSLAFKTGKRLDDNIPNDVEIFDQP